MYLSPEERAKREAWLKTLKVGDTVARVCPGGWGEPNYFKVTITKITPTGRLRIDGKEANFDSEGEEIKARGRGCPPKEYLDPWTPEIEAELTRRRLRAKARSLVDHQDFRRRVNEGSAEDLAKLIEVLKRFVQSTAGGEG